MIALDAMISLYFDWSEVKLGSFPFGRLHINVGERSLWTGTDLNLRPLSGIIHEPRSLTSVVQDRLTLAESQTMLSICFLNDLGFE